VHGSIGCFNRSISIFGVVRSVGNLGYCDLMGYLDLFGISIYWVFKAIGCLNLMGV